VLPRGRLAEGELSDARTDRCPGALGPPWGGSHRDFDDAVAWLVTHTAKSTVCELMRVAWRTVGSVVARVVADGRAARDPFDGLSRIGIDEISYKRGHRYLTVVVDHDSGRLVWAAVGRDKKTLNGFFDLLGSERCAKITLVSATAPSGSVTSSQSGPRTPRSASTASTWSSGPPTPSTRSVARSGTLPGARA